MEDPCLVCGQEYPTGSPSKYALSKTDTDHYRFAAPWSEMVCSACTWCSEGKPPDTLRMWSILYREDGALENPGLFRDYIIEKQEAKDKTYSVSALIECEDQLHLVNRADISPIVKTLIDPPDGRWFACVADSGHIHLVRFCQVNAGLGRWTIVFERQEVSAEPQDFARVLWHVASLRQAGFHTEDILTGEPHPMQLRKSPLEWITHMTGIVRSRTDLTRLSLFFCTKDWTDEYRDIAEKAVGADYRDDVNKRGRRSLERMPGLHTARQKRPQKVLGLGAKGADVGGQERSELRADGQRDARSSADRRGVQKGELQQNLFDC